MNLYINISDRYAFISAYRQVHMYEYSLVGLVTILTNRPLIPPCLPSPSPDLLDKRTRIPQRRHGSTKGTRLHSTRDLLMWVKIIRVSVLRHSTSPTLQHVPYCPFLVTASHVVWLFILLPMSAPLLPLPILQQSVCLNRDSSPCLLRIASYLTNLSQFFMIC